MTIKNNAPLQLFILFLLLIINGCQQGNVDSTSSNSAGTDTNMKMINEKLDELKNKMDEIMKQNIELKAELNEMKKLMKNKEEIDRLKEEDSKLEEHFGQKEEKANAHNLLMQIQEKMKDNQLNEADCGHNLKLEKLSVDTIITKNYSVNTGWNTVRAISPISTYNSHHDKMPSIASYYEVQILNKSSSIYDGRVIGFSNKQFPLEFRGLGLYKHTNTYSIGILQKGGMWIDGTEKKFEKEKGYFENGDVIGIGIIHKPNSKMECFATWNGKFLGKVELPVEFVDIQLFPAIGLKGNNDKISLNFGKHDWRFKEFEQLID